MSNEAILTTALTHHVRDNCLCLHAQRAARALARCFDRALRPHGLNNGQFSLMMALHRPAPPSLGAVAELLAMDRTTLTAKLKPLCARGWVEVCVDGRDARRRRLALTAAGRTALAAAVPAWRDTHADIETELTAARAKRLRADLRRLSARTAPAGD